jgi:hypothetical protein
MMSGWPPRSPWLGKSQPGKRRDGREQQAVDCVRMVHIKHHYYGSHKTINPTGIVPVGPLLDLAAPHGRERVAAAA